MARALRTLTPTLLIAALAMASPAAAGWSSSPVTVLSTTSSLAPIKACEDGAFGTFVVWQRPSGTGVLEAQHVRASGDVDPAWPASGASVCAVSATRASLGVMPDHLGGFYAWWREGTALYVTRIQGNGTVAPGWPARGRALGTVVTPAPEPCVIGDGAHGLYAAWVVVGSSSWDVRGMHLGPDGLAAAGWPTAGLVLTPSPPALRLWPRLSLAPDGGAYVAYAALPLDTTSTPSSYILQRVTSAGQPASGWPAAGRIVGPFRLAFNLWHSPMSNALIAIGDDGRQGLWLMFGRFDDGTTMADVRLFRLLGNGDVDATWPAEGRSVGVAAPGEGPEGSLVVFDDRHDGVLFGTIAYYSEGLRDLAIRRCTASGVIEPRYQYLDAPSLPGLELVTLADGSFFSACFKPNGPQNYFDQGAFLQVGHWPEPPSWPNWLEFHPEPAIGWYGDIALASSGDGGAIFFWSQIRERFGLFARRFNPGGEITAVTPQASQRGLNGVRFVRGAGVRLAVSLPESGGRIELFDLTGRNVAAHRIETGGALELTLPGTATLASGVYFVRVCGAGIEATERVAVLR